MVRVNALQQTNTDVYIYFILWLHRKKTTHSVEFAKQPQSLGSSILPFSCCDAV